MYKTIRINNLSGFSVNAEDKVRKLLEKTNNNIEASKKNNKLFFDLRRRYSNFGFLYILEKGSPTQSLRDVENPSNNDKDNKDNKDNGSSLSSLDYMYIEEGRDQIKDGIPG